MCSKNHRVRAIRTKKIQSFWSGSSRTISALSCINPRTIETTQIWSTVAKATCEQSTKTKVPSAKRTGEHAKRTWQPHRRQLKNETRESQASKTDLWRWQKKLSGKEESGRELNPSLPNSRSRRLQHGKSSDNWDRRPRRPSTDETDLGSTYSTLARESKKTEAEGGGNKISKRENELGTLKLHAQAGTRFEAAACASKNRIRG
jgi:hypothetical protein